LRTYYSQRERTLHLLKEVADKKGIDPDETPADMFLKEEVKRIAAAEKEHIEEFACAYWKHTGIPPDQAVMIIKDTSEGTELKREISFRMKAEGES
jgi:hypothetical protein